MESRIFSEIKIIPTMCNLKNMLYRLKASDWDESRLENREIRACKAYDIKAVRHLLETADETIWPGIIRGHILTAGPERFGANCLDIFLVGYLNMKIGPGRDAFTTHVLENGLIRSMNSALAVWNVGKRDGIFLEILNEDGSIKCGEFFSVFSKLVLEQGEEAG